MAKGVLNDTDILSVTAEHPTMGRLRYERTINGSRSTTVFYTARKGLAV